MKSTLFCISALMMLAIGVARAPETQARLRDPFEMFKKLDANRDKRLSEQEFVGEEGGTAKRAKARKQFRYLDKNGDKSLSLQEFKNN